MAASNVQEFAMNWPNLKSGSTHEVTFYNQDSTHLWVSGMMDNCLAKVAFDGSATYHPMKDGSQPHGLKYDGKGNLWVSLEYRGTIARLNEDGVVQEEIDVKLYVKGQTEPINPHPHGFTFAADGETIWFTGKKTNTVGKINPDRTVQHFEIGTVGAVLIYLSPGPDGNIWGTELVGNNILRITPEGDIDEFAIPTRNSRPIAIIPGPDGESMWFSQEAGNKVGRVDMEGNITEYPVPMSQKNVILGGMAFDDEGNLWTHSYVDQGNLYPEGPDCVIKMDKAINSALAGDISTVAVTHYEVPARNTVMHRIVQGPDGNIWFTELGTDKLGKLTINQKY